MSPLLSRLPPSRNWEQAIYRSTPAIAQDHHHILRLASLWREERKTEAGMEGQELARSSREPEWPTWMVSSLFLFARTMKQFAIAVAEAGLSFLRPGRSLPIRALDLLRACSLCVTVSPSAINPRPRTLT